MSIYLDNGNVSRVADEAFNEMRKYYLEKFGVPGGEFGHKYEEEATEALWKAREIVAKKINSHPDEIIFTSGVTEGNNLAVKGALLPIAQKKEVKAITSPIERKCVLRSFEYLKNFNTKISFVSVDSEGCIKQDDLINKIKDTDFVSIQHVNQEIGTVQDIKMIGELAEDEGAIYHTDATHSFLREKLDVEKIPVDILTVSGHVIHGPLGSGALFVREGLKLSPLFHGALRERGIRAGHPNIPAIMGFIKAIQLYSYENVEKMRTMRDFLIKHLLEIDDSKLNGHRKNRVCDNINVSFRGVEGEAILMLANEMDIILRTGSACYNESLEPSYVIKSLGIGVEYANSSTRMVLSRYNTMDEMKIVVEKMDEIIEKLRAISPIYRRMRK